jgi:hypothetical protein
MGVANAKDTTAKTDRAETSKGIFRMKEGYRYAIRLMNRKEEQEQEPDIYIYIFPLIQIYPTITDMLQGEKIRRARLSRQPEGEFYRELIKWRAKPNWANFRDTL